MARKIIRWREVRPRIGNLSRTQVWRLEKQDRFPKRVRLTDEDQSHGSAYGAPVGWYDDEIDRWVESRVRAGARAAPKRRRRVVLDDDPLAVAAE